MPLYSPHVQAALTVRVPRGHQGFWNIIRDLSISQGTFTSVDVEQRSNVHRNTVGDFIRRLVKAGYLELVEADHPSPKRTAAIYRLVRNQPDAPKLRRDGTPARDLGRGQEQMWRSMQMLREFTTRDLQVAATTSDVSVTLTTAASYIHHLAAAGYLRHVAPGLYRLRPQMMTGPLAPQIYRTDFVYDPNTGKVQAPLAKEAVEVQP